MPASLIERTVFVVSDSTGITAETFSNSVLSQFEQVKFEAIRIPFLDSPEKAAAAALRINKCALEQNEPPLVFSTLVNPDIAQKIRDRSEEHTSELQSLMRISYAVFCLKKKTTHDTIKITQTRHIRLEHKCTQLNTRY